MLKITIMPLFISKPFAIGNGDQMPRSSAKNLARTVLEFPDFFCLCWRIFLCFWSDYWHKPPKDYTKLRRNKEYQKYNSLS